ncbi:hypothetical protein HELRODRAFT_170302 [Helobdella robusta]|uniref:Uncharacterized protein n=1 Tax=Helobdella robusta TaxID=6412 RepID=T1F2W4_HELRO|nr:hypothetical protein HELRODRAFT_170302 [Helobdella robusta]ESO07754.1 hypothetical protein HELRODRAFT_170302 [Helobdella robusta]
MQAEMMDLKSSHNDCGVNMDYILKFDHDDFAFKLAKIFSSDSLTETDISERKEHIITLTELCRISGKSYKTATKIINKLKVLLNSRHRFEWLVDELKYISSNNNVISNNINGSQNGINHDNDVTSYLESLLCLVNALIDKCPNPMERIIVRNEFIGSLRDRITLTNGAKLRNLDNIEPIYLAASVKIIT